MARYAHIVGWGKYVPERVVNNHDLAEAKRRIKQYMDAFKNEGRRITENIDTRPA